MRTNLVQQVIATVTVSSRIEEECAEEGVVDGVEAAAGASMTMMIDAVWTMVVIVIIEAVVAAMTMIHIAEEDLAATLNGTTTIVAAMEVLQVEDMVEDPHHTGCLLHHHLQLLLPHRQMIV